VREEWEVVEEDEEVVDEEYEVVGEEEEVVEEDEEVAEDVVVVARPAIADEVEAYLCGVTDALPPLTYETWKRALFELGRLQRWKAGGAVNVQNLEERLKRARRLVFFSCPERPQHCPIYRVGAKCPVGLEASCRPFAWALARKRPRKIRRWFLGR
jgi:hypothetical protein